MSAIRSLREPEPELLLAVYGLARDMEYLPLLEERRARCGATIGRGKYTVADREPEALKHLRLQLVTGWYPLSTLGIRIPTSHNGIVFESVNVRVVVKDKLWHETRENYRLLAAFDEEDFVAISSSYPGRAEPIGEDLSVRTKPARIAFVASSLTISSQSPSRRRGSSDFTAATR